MQPKEHNMVDIAQETHEQTVRRVGADVAPRLTPDMIAATIATADFHRLTPTLTVCVLTLANGFTVTGESACASPANYNQEFGEKIAREMAIGKIWPLEGYALRNKLALVSAGSPPSQIGMLTYVGTKAVHAMPLTRGEYNAFRGWGAPLGENPDDAGYLVEYADGGEPNVRSHAGYVSWSPKAVFERSYELMS
jgi:hypothetical protein